MRPRIAALVVSRGLEGLLGHCLDCLARAAETAGTEGLAVVVDNASHPPYPAGAFAGRRLTVRTLRYDRSRSFAAANNGAAGTAEAAASDFLLLLNNDVLLNEGALASMLALADAGRGAAICGTRLLFPDGTIQHAGVVFGAGTTGPYHLDRRRPGHLVSRVPRDFQAVTGACLLVRTSLWRDLGGLDASYPFGLEDVDFCLRARQRGARIVCAGETDSLHFESMTPGRVALDVPSRRLFMERWGGRYTIDG